MDRNCSEVLCGYGWLPEDAQTTGSDQWETHAQHEANILLDRAGGYEYLSLIYTMNDVYI